MTKEDVQALVAHAADGVIEVLKFIPEGQAEDAVKIVQERIGNAKFDGTTGNIETILHRAVDCGVIISKETPNTKDDKLFEKADQFLDQYEANGENLFGAIMRTLIKRKKTTEGGGVPSTDGNV